MQPAVTSWGTAPLVVDWVAVSAFVGTALVVLNIAICFAALGIVPGNRRPSTGMAWLILVLVVPFLGLVAFLLVGRTNVEPRRHQTQLRANRAIAQHMAQVGALTAADPGLAYVASVATLNRNLGSLPAVAGNSVELFPDYLASIRAMTEEVDRATTFVHVQFYITAWDDTTDPFFAALVRATERGVKVRMLFDHLGSRGIPTYKETLAKLERTSIEWQLMMPLHLRRGQLRRPDLRNHRKILVVDGTVGFAGSQNLIDSAYNKPKNESAGRRWVELTCRVRGPVTTELNAVFLTDWYSETGDYPRETVLEVAPVGEGEGITAQVVPSGPGFTTENNLRMFTTLIYSAKRRISITSPYFVPDESMLYAITTAAQRGVEVELFVSEAGDQFMVWHAQRSYYQALLEAGVRIHLYPAPFVLHSKHFSIDDDVAVLGSSNMDLRSFALNYEVSLMLLGTEIVADMRAVEDTYRALSRELTTEEWEARSHASRYVDNVMRLTSALQ